MFAYALSILSQRMVSLMCRMVVVLFLSLSFSCPYHFLHTYYPQNDENIGQSSILKLVDQSDVGPYADYPLTLVKFKKGQTEDPKDDNSLWDITVTEPVATATGLQLESFLNYNADRCEWNSYVDSFEDLKRQIAAATDSDPDNRAKIEICEDRPIVFEDIIDFSNKYFEVSCLGDGCVFDLDGYSFVTPDGVSGSAFHAEFEGITVENGSPVSSSGFLFSISLICRYKIYIRLIKSYALLSYFLWHFLLICDC